MNDKRGGISLTTGIILIISIIAIMVYILWRNDKRSEIAANGTQTPQITQHSTPSVFSDGLNNPHRVLPGALDETGSGISEQSIFFFDINQDGNTDRIIRTHHENGTGHYWDEYNIQIIQNGKYVDITPPEFRTVIGTECALQKLQFIFQPNFKVVKISRPWTDSWNTPSIATRTVYTLRNNQLNATQSEKLGDVCDVTELFLHK